MSFFDGLKDSGPMKQGGYIFNCLKKVEPLLMSTMLRIITILFTEVSARHIVASKNIDSSF